MLVWKCDRHGVEIRMNWAGEFHVVKTGRHGAYFGTYSPICRDCEADDNPAASFRDDDK